MFSPFMRLSRAGSRCCRIAPAISMTGSFRVDGAVEGRATLPGKARDDLGCHFAEAPRWAVSAGVVTTNHAPIHRLVRLWRPYRHGATINQVEVDLWAALWQKVTIDRAFHLSRERIRSAAEPETRRRLSVEGGEGRH